MSERGSTGASSSSTTLPSASWCSRWYTVQLASASTITPAAIAMILRMARLLFFRPPVVKHETRAQQSEPGCDQQPRLEEQRGLQRVVVVREIAEQREDPQPG